MDRPRRIGLGIFLLIFGVFGVWAATAPIDSAAVAPGVVTVESYSKVVQHLEGGIISEILVRNGDRVEAGRPLLRLDSTQSLAQLEMANAQFVALKAREARLQAERESLEEIDFPDSLDNSASLVIAETTAQTEIFQARKAAHEGSIEVLEQRIGQLQSTIEGLRALRSSKQTLADSYSEEIADVEALLAQGFSERTRLRELERNQARLEGEVADLAATIATTEVQIGETRLQILQQDREFQNEVVAELSEVQSSLVDLTERMRALRDVVTRTTIRAPDDGIVNGMQFHTIGGVIAPGTKIVDIVPQGEDLIVEAQVATTDIDRVALDQDARIRFPTFSRNVPDISGRVINLSADRLVDEATNVPYYLARIEVTPEGMGNLGELVLLPGMPAEVFINTGSRTLLQYLFKPFSNAMARSFTED
ncbi:MAG: HlyD family type I secretion periplasmic adaptor subunit [Pseudomonadales bacterium]|nr:HlyD family type I secretion periplasmic adaptor subunit [Pseudomonadales bacterium]